jgi:hypothetical protein
MTKSSSFAEKFSENGLLDGLFNSYTNRAQKGHVAAFLRTSAKDSESSQCGGREEGVGDLEEANT